MGRLTPRCSRSRSRSLSFPFSASPFSAWVMLPAGPAAPGGSRCCEGRAAPSPASVRGGSGRTRGRRRPSGRYRGGVGGPSGGDGGRGLGGPSAPAPGRLGWARSGVRGGSGCPGGCPRPGLCGEGRSSGEPGERLSRCGRSDVAAGRPCRPGGSCGGKGNTAVRTT